ncbi:hypothetical protein TL16_g04504, partial [Triparma laevis f. inornata]
LQTASYNIFRGVRLGFSSTSNREELITGLDDNNVTENIASRVGRNLHLQPNHPLHTIKQKIETHFLTLHTSFETYSNLSPIVSTKNCFDDLLIPPSHVSRSPSDTYYISSTKCLRTHTSAHQSTLLKESKSKCFLCTGDVYRRDEIDRSHYPVFHQMEGVKLFEEGTHVSVIEDDLKKTLEGLTQELFGDVEMRWNTDYFPFTDPSWELEIYFNDEWLEVLGSGVIQPSIITNAGLTQPGWAFGLGLERLAMVLFKIPDIRLFWSKDERFLGQFDGGIVEFKPFSKYPSSDRDMSFWTGSQNFHSNDFAEIVRNCITEDIIESVTLIDEFTHPKTKEVSNCFRFTYRSMERSLTNEEIDRVHFKVRERAVEELGVVLR